MSYWNDSSLEKLTVIDFQYQFSKKIKSSEIKSSLWLDCRIIFVRARIGLIAELNGVDWVPSGSIQFDWNSIRLGSIDYAELKQIELNILIILHFCCLTWEEITEMLQLQLLHAYHFLIFLTCFDVHLYELEGVPSYLISSDIVEMPTYKCCIGDRRSDRREVGWKFNW